LVGEIANEARANKAEPLDEAGQRIFRDAGFENRIDANGSVDVDTRWLKPVIQVSAVILQRWLSGNHHPKRARRIPDSHRPGDSHSPYIASPLFHTLDTLLTNSPKIQPIHDPDPVRLQTRHRMFSPRTGHWHEVIGDEAAIELLGEDVFRNGPQTFREVRRALLPGLDDSYYDQPAEVRGGSARIIEREQVEGVTSGHWHRVAGDSILRDEEDGHVVDGLEGLGEGVQTMHLTL
jgi:hypothetical protein